MKLQYRRIRSGRYEYFCQRDRVWYWKLAGHIHRYHRASCHCKAICNPDKK